MGNQNNQWEHIPQPEISPIPPEIVEKGRTPPIDVIEGGLNIINSIIKENGDEEIKENPEKRPTIN